MNSNQIAVGLILLGLVVGLVACSDTSPEAAIRAQVDAIQAAVEAKQPGEVVAPLAEDFLANRQLDKRTLRQLLIGQFLRHKNIHLLITQLTIQVDQQHPLIATMQGAAVATGAQGLLPEKGRLYQFDGEWRLREDHWQLIRLHWQ